MEALELFELLAQQAHYNSNIQQLSQLLPENIRAAVSTKDGEALKSQLSG